MFKRLRWYLRKVQQELFPRDYRFIKHVGAILKFPRPDAEALDHICMIARRLPVSEFEADDLNWCMEAADTVGDERAVIARLSDVLRDDYEELQNDGVTWGGSFEFVVRMSDLKEGRLEILTRLFRYPKKGSVYYGCGIQRIGDDRYALWVLYY